MERKGIANTCRGSAQPRTHARNRISLLTKMYTCPAMLTTGKKLKDNHELACNTEEDILNLDNEFLFRNCIEEMYIVVLLLCF